MTRLLAGAVLGMTLVGGWRVTAADDPPKELTPEERKELQARWQEFTSSLIQSARAGKLPEAAGAGKKALEAARRLYPKQDHPQLAGSVNNLANVLWAQGKYVDAETLYREVVAMRRRLYPSQDHLDLAVSLNNLATVLDAQGKYADAETLYREALAMKRHLYAQHDHPDLAGSLTNLATVLREHGKYAEAEMLQREALAMRRRLYPKQDHPYLADSLTGLANVLRDQGKYADADTVHREALAMRRRLYGNEDHPDLASSQNNLAAVLNDQGKYADAETLFREALAMRRRLYPKQDRAVLADSLNNLARVLRAQGKYADAEALHREALEMDRRLYAKQDHPVLARSMTARAVMLEAQGKYADAEALHREALVMRRRLYAKQDHPDLAGSLNNLAVVLWAQGKYDDAETLFREALTVYRRLARDYAAVRSEGDALTLAATYAPARDNFLSNAWASKAAAATVYQEVWASKAALSRVYEQRGLAARAAATDPMAAALLDQLTDRRRGRADLLLAPTPSDPATAKQRATDLAQLATDIQTFDRQLRPLLPTLERADKLAQATPADLQKVLPQAAAVVDFLRWTLFEQDPQVPGRKGAKATVRYLAFVLTRDKVSWLDLQEAEPIETAVTFWREAITGGKEIPPELPAKVRQLIWDKVRQELPAQVKTVYLCPDLALCRVPWAALPGDRPRTILLEEYAVAVIPHAPFLLDKLWPQDAVPKRPTEVLAVGGVTYDATAPAPDTVASTRGAPLLKPGQPVGWPALPGAAAEAHGVSSAARKKNLVCRTLDKEAATSTAVLAVLPRVRWAHLATHGFFADASFRSAFQVDTKLFEMTRAGALSPMVMTGLVFAGANRPDTPGRGIITGEALVDLDLSGLELAVLSACETGLGDVAGGEGTFGLQRAFHLAGTRDVIASLWKVPDRPTAALMALFYQNLWEKDLPPIEALRQAQLTIYRHPERIAELAAGFRGKFVEVTGNEAAVPVQPGADGKAHPRLWAAFTLSGPGR
jgi:CHAT domain-containing protein/tetratricopeptide (TPR) repeat protein